MDRQAIHVVAWRFFYCVCVLRGKSRAACLIAEGTEDTESAKGTPLEAAAPLHRSERAGVFGGNQLERAAPF